MKAVVVYKSLWGNTAAVARAIAEGIGPGARALTTDAADAEAITGADLVVAGAPVHAFSLPRDGMRDGLATSESKAPAPPDLSHPTLRSWLETLPPAHGRARRSRRASGGRRAAPPATSSDALREPATPRRRRRRSSWSKARMARSATASWSAPEAGARAGRFRRHVTATSTSDGPIGRARPSLPRVRPTGRAAPADALSPLAVTLIPRAARAIVRQSLTMTSFITTFLALLALLAAIAIVLVAVFAAVGRMGDVRRHVGPIALWLAFAVAITSTAGSLYLSEVAGFVPCTLCWYQRIAMYPLVIILGLAAWRRDTDVRLYVGPLAAIGALIAAYHVALERLPALPSGACTLDAPCTVIWFEQFGFVTIPVMALVGFLSILALVVGVLRPAEHLTEGG